MVSAKDAALRCVGAGAGAARRSEARLAWCDSDVAGYSRCAVFAAASCRVSRRFRRSLSDSPAACVFPSPSRRIADSCRGPGRLCKGLCGGGASYCLENGRAGRARAFRLRGSPVRAVGHFCCVVLGAGRRAGWVLGDGGALGSLLPRAFVAPLVVRSARVLLPRPLPLRAPVPGSPLRHLLRPVPGCRPRPACRRRIVRPVAALPLWPRLGLHERCGEAEGKGFLSGSSAVASCNTCRARATARECERCMKR